MAVASSATPAVIEARLTALGVRALVEAVVSGAEIPRGKPEPDVFVETARRLGVAPARRLVVEDSRNGLRAALAAGMAWAVVPCAATREHDFSGAHLEVGELPALLPALGIDEPS
jgi:beta-phosphoglucomutase-like phosphatase (HAD superfamily)